MPWEPDPTMAEGVVVKGNIGIGALEREDVEVGREEGAGKRDRSLSFIKAVNVKRPLPGLKICLLPRGRADGTVGLPRPSFMRIP